ncbi:MAG: hypothetical protein JNK10_05800 [Cyclobacteriaceae bacterium]|nr:hypothetical protein [Cyclobacteriaceae bacterium]
MYRIVLLLLNAVAFGFLIHRLLKIYQWTPSGPKKNVVMAAGIILLLLPATMIFGFIKPTPVYMIVYPIGIGLFVYLFRLQD